MTAGQRDSMEANAGNDALWYVDTCNNNYNLDNSDAGGGNDLCGDTNEWGGSPWPQCENDIQTEPTSCPP